MSIRRNIIWRWWVGTQKKWDWSRWVVGCKDLFYFFWLGDGLRKFLLKKKYYMEVSVSKERWNPGSRNISIYPQFWIVNRKCFLEPFKKLKDIYYCQNKYSSLWRNFPNVKSFISVFTTFKTFLKTDWISENHLKPQNWNFISTFGCKALNTNILTSETINLKILVICKLLDLNKSIWGLG